MTTPKITIETKLITPAMAKKFLDKNHPKNRPIQWSRVEAFVSDIRRNAWQLTHQGICFDAEGLLIDGQHRLHAIVSANIAVEMVIAYNSVGAFEAPIDRGQPRTMSLISGKSRREIATVGLLKQLERGFQNNVPTTLEDLEEFGRHHHEGLQRLTTIKGYGKLLSGAAAAIVWTLPINEQGVTEWASAVITGEMLNKGHPALTFRRWIERKERIRPNAWVMALATFNCLRHYLSGMKITSVYTGESGYRAVTSQRRKLKVPFTPGTDLVPSLAFKAKADELQSEEE